MCGAECWTDHRPLSVSKLKRLNVIKLRDKSVSEDLTRELDGELAELYFGQATIEEDWVVFRDKIHDTAFQLIGPTTRKSQDWFDENYEENKAKARREESSSQNLPTRPIICSQKYSFHQHLQDSTNQIKQDLWLAAKADEIQK